MTRTREIRGERIHLFSFLLSRVFSLCAFSPLACFLRSHVLSQHWCSANCQLLRVQFTTTLHVPLPQLSVSVTHIQWSGGSFFKVGRSSTEDARNSRGYEDMLPQKILKSRDSEMPFPGFWGEILENSQDCKILRTAPNGFFNISLTLITGIRSFLILSLDYAIESASTDEIKRPRLPIYVVIRVQISARRL